MMILYQLFAITIHVSHRVIKIEFIRQNNYTYLLGSIQMLQPLQLMCSSSLQKTVQYLCIIILKHFITVMAKQQ